MNLAVVHHLPEGGGAYRVLAEYVAARPDHAFTVYTDKPESAPGESLVALPHRVPVVRTPAPVPRTELGRWREMWGLPTRGRAMAELIDAAGHDAAFVHASELTAAHEVLPHLRTPSLCYAPEPVRTAYEVVPPFGRDPSLRARLARAGLNPYERKRQALERAHIRAADSVVTHSLFTAGELRRIHGVEAAVVAPGVDARALTPPDGAREGYVLSVGALNPFKGHDFVVEALASLPPERRPPLVVVADRGGIGDLLEDLARRRGVELELLQRLPFPALVERYRRAGVVACGQVREPFGLVPLEAMATATPVVAVAEGGFRETVVDGETGLLVAREPGAFGRALARVLDSPALAERLGRQGRTVAERDWNWERTAAGYDKLLAALVARATTRHR